jgi:hypothetical protein
MKRKCGDPECRKKFVVSKDERRQMRDTAPAKGDENLCHSCFKDVCNINYDQSYFGSIKEWGV